MSLIGGFLQVVYRLRRHFCLAWPMSRWVGLLLAIAILATLLRWWPNPIPAAALSALYLCYLAALAWAQRRRFLYFQLKPEAENWLQDSDPAAPLQAEELVPVRASGWFTVEGQHQYYLDLEADFETVGLREHIVLARVVPSRFLLVGRWPSYELGWWYIFFQPTMIRRIDAGLRRPRSDGARPRPALRVVYAPDAETQHTIYLTFDTVEALRRVWVDLLLDAPADLETAPEWQRRDDREAEERT